MDEPRISRLPLELDSEQLYATCNPSELEFSTTDELPDLIGIIGQPRAVRALELGSEVTGAGYNIFVLGLPGSGRTTLSQEYLQIKASQEAIPDDWGYINNFENPRSPRYLRLPSGKAIEFRKDLNVFISVCVQAIAKAFESEEYRRERERLIDEFKKAQEAEFIRLQDLANKLNFIVARTPVGIVLVPGVKGEPLKPEEIERLSPEQRAKLEQIQTMLGEEVEKTLAKLREIGRTSASKMDELNRQTIQFITAPLIEELQQKYNDLEMALSHLESIHNDILNNATIFQPPESGQSGQTITSIINDWKHRYNINILVDHSQTKGAPVVLETHPVYHNLLGRIEHEVVMGATKTDFTMIRPGAFHRANGGYLILPARDLLINPFAWEGVKRALRDGCIRILELGSQVGLLSTETLDPEPIPLDVKVVLVGTPLLYYLLQVYDEDFNKLFKVRAEFATSMVRDPASEREYSLFVKSVVLDNQLPSFDANAVARIIEYSSRIAGDQRKLTTRFGKIADVIREAAYWAKKINPTDAALVSREAVERAIEEEIYRNNLLEERHHELIVNGIQLISVDGYKTGQINALAVVSIGDTSFGYPNRLTVSVAPGRGGVIDIERQAKLGGPIHTKGVLILSGFLNGRYGNHCPLNLSASLTFEQSYNEIEGDSASAAELITLLSALADVPIRQDIAITGSVNQHGQIQAIGGVNEKIEGFFAVCQKLGLSGSQGVIIPKSNVRNLMLHKDVIEAVSKHIFHIYPVENIDEAVEIMTGVEPGLPDLNGKYTEDSLNGRIVARLVKFSTSLNHKETPDSSTPIMDPPNE